MSFQIYCQDQSILHEKILKWKYNSIDKSIIYPFIKKNICTPIANKIPYNISPNTLTIFGFLFTVLNTVICYVKQELFLFDYILISIFSFSAFIFDALDGEQGRKWKKDGRDIYVLTQLYDHGFDSLTAFLNVYITCYILNIDNYYRILVYVILSGTFLISTHDYKVNRCMRFEFYNNPTESVVINCLLIIYIGLFGRIQYTEIIIVIIGIINISCNFITLLKTMKNSLYHEERIEAGINLVFISLILLNNKYYDFSYFIMISLCSHIITINYIVGEIYQIHCCKDNIISLIPIFLVSLSIFMEINIALIQNMIFYFNITLFLSALYIWRSHSITICKALQMKNIIDMPIVNNNPFNKF